MSTEVRWRRGTAAQNDAFTGALAEVTVDTTNNGLRVHDGVTVGGHLVGNQPDHIDTAQVGQPINPAGGNGYSFRFANTELSGNALYDRIFPDITHFDGLQSVVDVLPGAGVHHVTAIAGYIRSEQPATDFWTSANSVALFGLGIAAANDAAVWSINTLLQDDDVRAAGTATGRKLVGELDYNVMHTGTEVIGLSLGGNGLAQPAAANAFIVNSLEGSSTAGLVKWDTAFWSFDGCADYGLVIGTKHKTGSNLPSQDMLFKYRGGDGNPVNIAIRAQAGGYFTLNADNDASFDSLQILSGNVVLDAGQALVVGGNGVVSGRQTGWTVGTGTPARGTFDADYSETIGASFDQAQVQALNDMIVATRQRLLAIETDMRNHGLIGA